MDRYHTAFEEALIRNSEDEQKWKKYKAELEETRTILETFVKSRSIEIMVPMGKKAYVHGKLQHTNEITVTHGSSLFSECSTTQAVEIINHRLHKCDERLSALKMERDLFKNKLELPAKEGVFADGKEIIEDYNEATEMEWRQKHVESVRKQKQWEAYERQNEAQKEEAFHQLLDDYEMKEELAEELENLDIKDDEVLTKLLNGEIKAPETKPRITHSLDVPQIREESNNSTPNVGQATETLQLDPAKYNNEINNNDLIAQNNQEIIELLKNYRSKIKEVLKNVRTNDERNLSLFLDLTELKDDIEQDIDMLNENEEYTTDEKDSDDETESIDVAAKPAKRKVRFSTSLEDVKIFENVKPSGSQDAVNELEPHTIQINFQHSSNRSTCNDSHDYIASPADIYQKFHHSFTSLTPPSVRKSILKNNNHKSNGVAAKLEPLTEKSLKKIFHADVQVIGDVVEHKLAQDLPADEVIHITCKDDAPKKVSKFRAMRLKS